MKFEPSVETSFSRGNSLDGWTGDLLYLPAMGRAVDLETFRFGKKQVTVDIEELYDKIFFEQWEFCMWLLEHDGWRNLDAICQHFHPDHVEILSNWVEAEILKYPD